MQAKRIGTCDNCDLEGVELWSRPGNLLLCENCRNEEDDAYSRGKKDIPLVERSRQTQATIHEFRPLDEKIPLKEDLFNAKTPIIVEIESNIRADASIPADRKVFACTAEVYKLFKKQQDIVFGKRQDLLEAENLLRTYQNAGQNYANQLGEKDRAEYYEFDKNYKPDAPKKVKPTPNPSVEKRKKATPRKPKVDAGEVIRIAAKYRVKESHILSMLQMGFSTLEDCEKSLADMAVIAAAATKQN